MFNIQNVTFVIRVILKLPSLFYSLYFKKTRKEKVFIVSNNKCGTTTLKHHFKKNKFNVAPQWLFEVIFYNLYYKKKNIFFPIFNYLISKYDCFQDVPFQNLKIVNYLIKKYPDSLFIQITRGGESWYKSLMNHQKIELLNRNLVNANDDLSALKKATKKMYYRFVTQEFIITKTFNISNELIYDRETFISKHQKLQENIQKSLKEKNKIIIKIEDLNEKFPDEIKRYFDLPHNTIQTKNKRSQN